MISQNRLSEMQREWRVPYGLHRSRPRPVELTRSGRALLIVAVVLAIGAPAGGIALGLAAHRQAEDARLLREGSTETEGLVIRLWRGRDDKKQPWMAYRFSRQGQVYEADARVSLRLWQSLRVGSHVPVFYVPSRPELNSPFTTARTVLPLWVPFPIAFLMAGGSILATVPLRRQRRLLSEGRPAPGLVVKHGKPQRDSHGRQIGEKYYYEFPLLSGAIAKGEAGPRKNPPAIGSVISVVYDPDQPPRNAPYPLSLVRLAEMR